MMSIIVNTDGQVCVASDCTHGGVPSSISFNPGHSTLTLQFEDGRQERLGTAGLSEIRRLLHRAGFIRFMQMGGTGPAYRVQLPLYVRMDEDQGVYAEAI